MPKCEIDYSNTIIYKITCMDTKITDLYIGHTTNFVQRKHAHKGNCVNEKAPNYKCKLYETIRNNGGWNNWKMEIVNFFNCKDHNEARQKEQEYFVLLNATLNSIEPFPKKNPKIQNVIEKVIIQPIYCEKCNVYFNNVKLYEIHTNTKKHINKQNNITNNKFFCEKCNYGTSKKSSYDNHLMRSKHTKLLTGHSVQNNGKQFYCNVCDYKCSKKSDYTKHLLTSKHINNDNLAPMLTKKYICDCGKEYKYRQGLFTHRKTCETSCDNENHDKNIEDKDNTLKNIVLDVIKQTNEMNNKGNNEVIQYLIKENNELKHLILQIVKKD